VPDIFDEVVASLDRLSNAITKTVLQDDELIDIWGWNSPVLTKDQIGEGAYDLSERIKRIAPEQKTKHYIDWLEGTPAKIEKFISITLPNLNNVSASTVGSLLLQLLSYIEGRLPPDNWPTDWEAAANAGQMPGNLTRRLRGLEARLTALDPRSAKLESQIERIESAHAAAETLPTDLESLEEARKQVATIAAELNTLADAARAAQVSADKHVTSIKDQSDEAIKLMGNIDSAYRASTSKALADAFAKRSFWLQVQTWVFVALLILALGVGGALGFRRVSMLEQLMKSNRAIDATLLWMNVALSFLSVAAPVWFAWVATKQITQRFRLAEDYGFKAAVAKAYEGYRREAAAVDPLFVTRLFGSALARLEEAPLRLVDEENYGSPFHELTASPGFREALGIIPALRESYGSILNAMSKRTRQGAVEAASTKVSTAAEGAIEANP